MKTFSLKNSFKNSIVLDLTFRCMIHFVLIFVNYVTKRSKSVFVPVSIHLLK